MTRVKQFNTLMSIRSNWN